jgi:hypothetical protein
MSEIREELIEISKLMLDLFKILIRLTFNILVIIGFIIMIIKIL